MKNIVCILIILIPFSVLSQNQNVAINNTGQAPDASAMLDISSTSKGLLIPRMSSAQIQAIATPAIGLLVFDNTLNQFWYYNGTSWVTFSSGGSGGGTLNDAYNFGGAGAGRMITASSGSVEVNTNSNSAIGFKSLHSSNGVAIAAEGSSVLNTFSVIQATTASNQANTAAILGNSTGVSYGLSGQVMNTATAEAAVYGNNLRTTGGHGVMGQGLNGSVGLTNYSTGYGVYGENTNSIGTGTGDGIGVAGLGFVGVLGETFDFVNGWGVLSNGDMGSLQGLYVSGTKSFRIDHPQDPENKYLQHFCIESPEVLNVYRGTIQLNANGEAVVELPGYFEDININYSYQLTAIGTSAPGLYISKEIQNETFVISGGNPGQKVSWTVYAERNDPYLQKYPEKKNAEPEKEAYARGKYLHPDLYGQNSEKGIFKEIKRIQKTKQTQLNIISE